MLTRAKSLVRVIGWQKLFRARQILTQMIFGSCRCSGFLSTLTAKHYPDILTFFEVSGWNLAYMWSDKRLNRLQSSRFRTFSEGAKRRKRDPRVWSTRSSHARRARTRPFVRIYGPSLAFAKNTTVLQSSSPWEVCESSLWQNKQPYKRQRKGRAVLKNKKPCQHSSNRSGAS